MRGWLARSRRASIRWLVVAPQLSAEEIRAVNTRYHDVAAHRYDAKWGIDFGSVGRDQVAAKLRKALGGPPQRWPRALEIGAGTGYFTLNMLALGLIEQATCIDISPGMLARLRDNADSLGLTVDAQAADAERLPFGDEGFDLVFGHAVLHHIPDLARALAEFERVLAPGGMLLFAGEPSLVGDHLASVPKRAAGALAPLWRRVIGARESTPALAVEHEETLEAVVDVHAFAPTELARLASEAGFTDVKITGEELLANWFGWANRTLESSAEPSEVPWIWRQYAYRGYRILQQVDDRLLESRLPAEVFYNLMVTGRKPDARPDGA
jgi:ubiquinone/menaquinone biosynthesis C-methylase UbiE